MTKQWMRLAATVILTILVCNQLNRKNLDVVLAQSDWDRSVTLSMETVTETQDADTVNVAVLLEVPVDGRLDFLTGCFRYDSACFDCDTAAVTPGLIDRDAVYIISNGNLTFLYDKLEHMSQPIPAGQHTLFTVTLSIREGVPKGKQRFDLQVEEAYNIEFEGGYHEENIQCDDVFCEIYIGEIFRVTPQTAVLYEGEKLQISLNKEVDEVLNSSDGLLHYDPSVGEITAKTLPSDKDWAVGILMFSSGTESATVTITVKKKEFIPEPKPQPQPEPQPQPQPQYTKGDVNGDGKITATDYVNVKFHVLGKQTLSGTAGKAADVNGDGKITATDYVNIKFHVLQKNPIRP